MNIENIFNFIKEKRGYDYPFVYKVVKGLPLSDDELNIKGDFLLRGNNVKLPDNLIVSGDLTLGKLNNIPKNLKIGGDLVLYTPSEFTSNEIIKFIEDKGGVIYGTIYQLMI